MKLFFEVELRAEHVHYLPERRLPHLEGFDGHGRVAVLLDVWGYCEHDEVVRWFLGRRASKSELHRRAKGLKGEVREVFRDYVKELEGKLGKLGSYFPSIALHGKVGELWAIDSFLIEVPFGKRDRETLRKKFQVSLKQGKLREAADLLFLFFKSRVRRH